MVNTDYDKFRSFSRLYVTLLRHRTCTYLHGRADRFLVLVSDGQVAALSDGLLSIGFIIIIIKKKKFLRSE